MSDIRLNEPVCTSRHTYKQKQKSEIKQLRKEYARLQDEISRRIREDEPWEEITKELAELSVKIARKEFVPVTYQIIDHSYSILDGRVKHIINSDSNN
jgi:hypothetical protein